MSCDPPGDGSENMRYPAWPAPHSDCGIQGRELASPLTIFLPYRPNGFLQSSFFLICAELISALFLFLRYRGGGKCRDKIVSKNAGRIFLPFRPLTILPAFAVLFNSDGRPVFREAHFDILRVLSQSEKLLIAFHPCLLCSDLNA